MLSLAELREQLQSFKSHRAAERSTQPLPDQTPDTTDNTTENRNWQKWIEEQGNKAIDWLLYTNYLKQNVNDGCDPTYFDFICSAYAKAIRVISSGGGTTTESYAQLFINYANFVSLKDIDDARDLFYQAKAKLPGYAIVHIFSAQFELNQGNRDRCRKILDGAIKVVTKPPGLLAKIRNNFLVGHSPFATEDLLTKFTGEQNENRPPTLEILQDSGFEGSSISDVSNLSCAKTPYNNRMISHERFGKSLFSTTMCGSSIKEPQSSDGAVFKFPELEVLDPLMLLKPQCVKLKSGSDLSDSAMETPQPKGNTIPSSFECNTDEKRPLRTSRSTPDCKSMGFMSERKKRLKGRARRCLPQVSESNNSNTVEGLLDMPDLDTSPTQENITWSSGTTSGLHHVTDSQLLLPLDISDDSWLRQKPSTPLKTITNAFHGNPKTPKTPKTPVLLSRLEQQNVSKPTITPPEFKPPVEPLHVLPFELPGKSKELWPSPKVEPQIPTPAPKPAPIPAAPVYTVFDDDDNNIMAVMAINIDDADEEKMISYRNEIQLLQAVQSSNCVNHMFDLDNPAMETPQPKRSPFMMSQEFLSSDYNDVAGNLDSSLRSQSEPQMEGNTIPLSFECYTDQKLTLRTSRSTPDCKSMGFMSERKRRLKGRARRCLPQVSESNNSNIVEDLGDISPMPYHDTSPTQDNMTWSPGTTSGLHHITDSQLPLQLDNSADSRLQPKPSAPLVTITNVLAETPKTPKTPITPVLLSRIEQPIVSKPRVTPPEAKQPVEHLHVLPSEITDKPRTPLPPPKVEPHIPTPAPKPAPTSAAPEHDHIVINSNNYYVLKRIGQGGTSSVYAVFDDDKNIKAVKAINMTDADEATIISYRNEIQLLQALQSSNRVIHMYDFEFNEQKNMLYVLMEKGDTDLASFFHRNKTLDDIKIKYFWQEMVKAVQVLHEKGIIHTDLKPANFVLVAGHLKLIDFGIARTIQQDKTSLTTYKMVGTVNFMSPEALTAECCENEEDELGMQKWKSKIGFKSDVWSLGCILYTMVYRRTPFQAISHQVMKMRAIIDHNHKIEFPPIPNTDLHNTIQKCLIRDVRSRPSIKEVLNDSYLQECKDH